MKRNKISKRSREKLMEQNLELTKRFLLDVIKNPEKVKNIPSGATIILYPVKV